MAKEKLTDETLLDKCSNEDCMYNDKSFCTLHSIMIDDFGKCIYNTKRKDDKDGTS